MHRSPLLNRLSRFVPMALITVSCASVLRAQRSDFHWEKALASGSLVTLHNINGDIKVVPSTTGRVEVNGYKRGNSRNFDRIKAEVHETSRGISVCVLYDDADDYCDENGLRSRSHNGRDWDHLSMNLEVAIPASVEVSANTVSGDVSVDGAHGNVTVNSVSGDVRLDRLHASAVSAKTVSGDVDVQIDELTGSGALSFHSVSGDVTLDLPRGFGAELSMSTVSGDINSDFPITIGNGRMNRRSLNARIGSGGRRLDVSTVSGDLKLRMGR